MIKQQQQRSKKRPLIPTSKQDSRTNKTKKPSTRTRSYNNTILIVELLAMKAHLLERRRAFGRLSGVHDHVRIRVRIRARVRGVSQQRIPPSGQGLEPSVPLGVPVLHLPRSFRSLYPPVFCDLDAARARPIASACVGRTSAGAGAGGCWDDCWNGCWNGCCCCGWVSGSGC